MGVPQAGDDAAAWTSYRPREGAQGLPGTDLEERRVRLLFQHGETVGKAHRLAELSHPILRICGLRRLDPRPGNI